jgi:nicotinamide mononucleotide transporter PnuC
MQFVGMYVWSKELDNQSTTRVKSLKLIGWIIVIILCIGLAFLFFYEIPAFAKLLTTQYYFESMFIPHVLDATTNAISVVGQFLLILCYWEQYILWTCVNIMAIIMYSGNYE